MDGLAAASLKTVIGLDATAAPSGEVWYVDPSASGSSEDGTTANPYLSLNAALAGKCNKTFTQPIQIRCRTSGSTPDTVRATTYPLVGIAPSATNYLEIVAETGHRAGASWDATKYHLYPAYSAQDGTALKITVPHVRLDGIQIGISTQTGIAEIVYWTGGTTGPSNSRMSNCLIRGTNSSSYLTRGLSTEDITLWNCIIYNIGPGSSSNSVAVQTHEDVVLYNCTFFSGGIIVVNNNGGTSIAKNSYAGGASWQCWINDGAGSLTLTTCAASDATGTAGLDNIAINTTNFGNVTPGSEDWSLPGGSALIGVGTDTSGESAPLNFTTDIEGATRTAPWDIGAVKA